MKRRSKLISYFLFVFLIFEIILPVNSSLKVYADSQIGESISEIENGVQGLDDIIEGEMSGDLNEELPELLPGDDLVEEVTPGDGSQEEVKPDGAQDANDEEDSMVNPEEENSKEDESLIDTEEGKEPGVLEGGILDEPISNWAFSGVEDLNKDGVVNEKDLTLAAAKYNLQKGQAGYEGSMDFNNDGIIDIYDLTRISIKSGSRGKIVIDPGHGGDDPGAVGPTGLQEKDIVLKVSLKVRDLLESYGYTVVMTRTTDVYLSLQERCDIANNSQADLFISIHNNSFSDPSANGTETFSYFPNDTGGQVAKSIQSKLIDALGLRNRGHKTSDFYVLRNTNMPAALTELAFISNPREEALLNTDEFQTKAARAIVDGILGI